MGINPSPSRPGIGQRAECPGGIMSYRRSTAERVREWWKKKFVNFEFPWLWGVRPHWDFAATEMRVEVAEESPMFRDFLRGKPKDEVWVHSEYGDTEVVMRVSFEDVDWSNPNAVIHAIWKAESGNIIHIALVKEELSPMQEPPRRMSATIFRTKYVWGMNALLRHYVVLF